MTPSSEGFISRILDWIEVFQNLQAMPLSGVPYNVYLGFVKVKASMRVTDFLGSVENPRSISFLTWVKTPISMGNVAKRVRVVLGGNEIGESKSRIQ